MPFDFQKLIFIRIDCEKALLRFVYVPFFSVPSSEMSIYIKMQNEMLPQKYDLERKAFPHNLAIIAGAFPIFFLPEKRI